MEYRYSLLNQSQRSMGYRPWNYWNWNYWVFTVFFSKVEYRYSLLNQTQRSRNYWVFTVFFSKVEYRYLLLNQSERSRNYWVFSVFFSKVEYRYSLLNQSERSRDIDHDLENALHPTSVVFDDSDEVCTCKRASSRQNLSPGVCEQQSRRPACTSAQSDQHLCYSLIGKYHM